MLKKIPGYIRYTSINILIFFIYAFLHRVFFYSNFLNLKNSISENIIKAFFLGIRFDIKMSVLVVFPIYILIFIVNTKFFTKRVYKKISSIYFIFFYLLITLFYLFDYGYYDYFNTRLDATSLRFINDLKISSQVILESYPIFEGSFILLIFLFGVYKLKSYIYKKIKNTNRNFSRKTKVFYTVITFLLMSFGVYNSFTHYPLRWSQAFFSKENNINQFALNPVLYFFDSFAFRSSGFDFEKTKKYYPAIADFLALPNDSILFERKVIFKNPYKKKPNVVIVMLESVGVASTSFFGNPINSTPKIDSLLKKSVHFTNFFVQKAGTAGSVFSSITGLPDVDNIKTASRNPMVIDQRIIFDQFEGYKKLYFLGGSANWANIRGIFQSNVNNLKIFEEGSYEQEKRVDVWGIDDYDLFKKSDKELKKLHNTGTPFIAYIQTSTNHMPFTVPDKKGAYRALDEGEISEELLKKSGFKSVAQINAIRYLDFNVDVFLKRAKKSGYYQNTIFLFFGDHNTHMNYFDFMERNESLLDLSVHHVLFFINAPMFVEAREIDAYGNLIDLFPTAAAVAKLNHTNYTLGSNLLDSTRTEHVAFLYKKIAGEPAIELLKNGFSYTITLQTNRKSLYRLDTNKLVDIKAQNKLISQNMDSLLRGFYYSTQYLYYNNKKKNVPSFVK